jgi:hypothetical protein
VSHSHSLVTVDIRSIILLSRFTKTTLTAFTSSHFINFVEILAAIRLGIRSCEFITVVKCTITDNKTNSRVLNSIVTLLPTDLTCYYR